MVNIGVVGYGYWGPNIVRNFNAVDGASVISVCDKKSKALKDIQKTYPSVQTTSDYNEVITSPDIDAVAIVTPVFTHFELGSSGSSLTYPSGHFTGSGSSGFMHLDSGLLGSSLTNPSGQGSGLGSG